MVVLEGVGEIYGAYFFESVVIEPGGGIRVVECGSIEEVSKNKEILDGKSQQKYRECHVGNSHPLNIRTHQCKTLIKIQVPTMMRTKARRTTI